MIVSSSTRPARERLPDDVGAASDADVLVAGGLDGHRHGLLHAVDEGEGAALGLLLRAVGHDEDRHAPRVLVAPVAGRLVHPAAADAGAAARHRVVQERLVLAGRLGEPWSS